MQYRATPFSMPQYKNHFAMNNGTTDLIKQLVDPLLVVHALGINITKITQKEARGTCPVHEGDNPTSFRIRLDTGNWVCFSQGCHEGDSDIIGLVKKVKRYGFVEALRYLADLAHIDLTNTSDLARTAIQRKEISQFVRSSEKNQSEMNLCTIYNIEEQIRWLNQHRTNFFIDKGYDKELLDYFEVGGEWIDFYGIIRETIALRDDKGVLIGFDGRRKDSDDDPRYRAQPEGLRKDSILYHYYQAKNWISVFGGKLFIVEGYKACWSMIKYGWLNTVACLGAGLNYGAQTEILFSNLELKEIILLLDGDVAGKNGARRSAKMLQNFFKIKIINLEDGKDPSNMKQKELQTAIEQILHAKEQKENTDDRI